MKKFILAIILSIAITASASAANSDDIYLRRDVFEAKMDAFMAEIKLMNQNMRSDLRQDIHELSKAVSVLSERTDRNFEILSARIDRLDARIDSTNTRIDDLRNGLYLWLVVIGTFIAFMGVVVAWPRIKDFLTAQKNTLTIQDVERIIDAKLNSKSQ